MLNLKSSKLGIQKISSHYEKTFVQFSSKLDDEGKPVLRADGKVMKGPNYQPPDLSDLVCLK